MPIKTITTTLVFNMTVNCYLVGDESGFALIDTGHRGQRTRIDQAMTDAGCKPGNLKLIILTHGDYDHAGNAAFFRQRFLSKIAMHRADLGMVERGDFFASRKTPNPIMKFLMNTFFAVPKADRHTPDVFLKEGDDLSAYGVPGRVVEIPGHSGGSIGILTPDGALFCGDLLGNTKKPDIWTLIDDRGAAQASIARLKALPISAVYPGHGKSFPITALWENYRQ